MEKEDQILVSTCCNSSDLIEPDWELAEEMGSLWRAYACYICKKCGKACEVKESSNQTPDVL